MSEFAEPGLRQPVPEPPREIPFWTMQDLAVMIGLALPAMLISAIAVRLAVGAPESPGQSQAIAVIAVQFLSYGLWFACLWALLRFRYDWSFWRAMAWVDPPAGWLRYLAYGPLLAIAVGFAGRLLQTPEIRMPMTDLLADRFSLFFIGAFAVTLGPLCEELAFRGFFLPRLSKSLGVVAAVLLTSGTFALLHGPQYAWSWRHILLITAAGVGFCVVRLRTGSTAAATVMHASYNLTFFVAYLTHMEEIGATW